jgi:hypothetical protein
LETYEKTGVPKGTGCVATEVETKVLELHDQHADWEKHRITDEIAKQRSEKPSAEEITKPKLRARWGSRKVQEEQRQVLRKQHRQQSR